MARRSHSKANTIERESQRKSKLRRKRKGLKGFLRKFFSRRRTLARRLVGFAIVAFSAVLLASVVAGGWSFARLVKERMEARNAAAERVYVAAVEEAESLLAGRNAMKEVNHAAAEKHFTRVTELNPKSTEGWTLLADAQLKQGNEQDALVSLHRRNELPPESARPHFMCARIYRSQGKAKSALQCAREAARIAPLDPLYSNTLYILRIQNGELDQVREELARTVGMSQMLEPTWIFGRAAAALAQGDEEVSIRYILRARDLLHQDTYNTLLYEEFFAPVIDKATAIATIKADTPVAPLAARKPEEPSDAQPTGQPEQSQRTQRER